MSPVAPALARPWSPRAWPFIALGLTLLAPAEAPARTPLAAATAVEPVPKASPSAPVPKASLSAPVPKASLSAPVPKASHSAPVPKASPDHGLSGPLEVDAAIAVALAQNPGLDAAQVSVGAGSVALISEAITATSSEGHSVVHGLPSFEAYPQLVRLAGARSAEVPNDASRLDPNGFVTVANVEDARLVLIANPNNPTGTAWRTDEVLSVLNGVASDTMVVLDEAYHEFVTDPDVPDGVELLSECPNLVVLRTFSKAWGLAGLRIGYALGSPTVIAALDAVRLPFLSLIHISEPTRPY